MTLLQDTEQPTSATAIIKRIIEVLNTPFIGQPGQQYSVSIMSLFLLIVVIVAAVFVSRYMQRFLEKRVLPRFHHVDAGLRYTLLRIIHYLIMILATLWAVKVGFSVDLTGVAVILGFLSVGVGFGLQYIASDLASGFILLFERPLRVGDRLKMGDIEGRVDSIRLRSTTLTTNDDVTVVVPNSELVRGKVVNWSYCERVRIRIPAGAAYGSDVREVTAALIEAGRNVDHVLKDPPPKVYLKGFGESAIDFELLVWIDRPHDHQQIRSDINYGIERIFGERGIEIPFPQRDLRLRSGAIRIAQNGEGLRFVEPDETEGETMKAE
ncbi:MAG TPA: mechanosensitive ion channel domain-containing protein [Blastocatellia bacterium]|nr:mechanosensitive ion channel domain-containing protein [Blastocatellia bacterium]